MEKTSAPRRLWLGDYRAKSRTAICTSEAAGKVSVVFDRVSRGRSSSHPKLGHKRLVPRRRRRRRAPGLAQRIRNARRKVRVKGSHASETSACRVGGPCSIRNSSLFARRYLHRYTLSYRTCLCQKDRKTDSTSL